MDRLQLLGVGLMLLTVICMHVAIRLAIRRRRRERMAAPPQKAVGDPRHLAVIMLAPAVPVAAAVFFGLPVAIAAPAYFGLVAIALAVYGKTREKAAAPTQIVED